MLDAALTSKIEKTPSLKQPGISDSNKNTPDDLNFLNLVSASLKPTGDSYTFANSRIDEIAHDQFSIHQQDQRVALDRVLIELSILNAQT